MKFKYYLFLSCLVFISWFGISLSSVHADEIDATWSLGARIQGSTGSYQSLPLTSLPFDTTWEVRLQCNPSFNFVDEHYYKIKIDFLHSYGQWSFDTVEFYNSSYYHVATSNFSTNKYNADMYHSTLTLDGVADVDVNRVIQRIRFFYNCTVQSSGSTTSGSIHLTELHLNIEDVTDSYVLPSIDDKLTESNQKSQTIIDRLTSLPDRIKDMLLSFFVPTQSELDVLIYQFNQLVYNRLGCVAQTLDFFGDIISSFVNATASDTIFIPRLEVKIPVSSGQSFVIHNIVLWQGGNVEIMPSDWDFAQDNIEYIRFMIDIICLFMLFRYLLSVFHSIVSPETAASLTLNEILEELEMRTLD